MLKWLKKRMYKAAITMSLVPHCMNNWVGEAFSGGKLKLLQDGYKKSAVYFACLHFLATSTAEPKMVVRKPDGLVDESHPVAKLLRSPNPNMAEFEFWYTVVSFIGVTGDSYFWIQRDQLDRPIAMWPLRSDRVAPILSTNLPPVTGWRYTIEGKTFELPYSDVLAFSFPDISGNTAGLAESISPLQVLAAEVDTDLEATKLVYSMMSNYAAPGIVIRTTDFMDEDETENVKRQFKTSYGGTNRGEPAILHGADSQIDTISFNLSELEFPDLREVSESRMAAVLGVPPMLVGLKVGLEHSTFSNVAEARRFFAETTLSVMWRHLADQVAAHFADDLGANTISFDISDIPALAEVRKEKATFLTEAAKAGLVTVNEWRQGTGFEPVTGGDVFLRPISMIPEVVPGTGTKPITVAPQDVEDSEDTEDGAAILPRKRALPAPWRRKAIGDFVGRTRLRRERLAHQMGRALEEVLAEQREAAELSETYTMSFETKQLLTETARGYVFEAISYGIEDALSLLVPDAKTGARLLTKISPADLQVTPPRVNEMVDGAIAKWVEEANVTTQAEIRRLVREAAEEGKGNTWLAEKLESTFGASRANTIARTVTAATYNAGALAQYGASRVINQVEIFDGDDCGLDGHDDTEKANGMILDIADAEDIPISHPNCVRAYAPIFDEDAYYSELDNTLAESAG